MRTPHRNLVGAFLLVAVLALPAQAQSPDCCKSFDLGRLYARRQHRAWGWYLAGAALVALGSMTSPQALPDISRLRSGYLALGARHDLRSHRPYRRLAR
jgi:hypothetical protein